MSQIYFGYPYSSNRFFDGTNSNDLVIAPSDDSKIFIGPSNAENVIIVGSNSTRNSKAVDIGDDSGFNVDYTNGNCLLRVRPVSINGDNNGGVEIGSVTGNTPYIAANQGVGSDGSTIVTYGLNFRTSNETRMTIQPDGDVKIGNNVFNYSGRIGFNTGDVAINPNVMIQNPATGWPQPQFLISSSNTDSLNCKQGFLVRGDYTTFIKSIAGTVNTEVIFSAFCNGGSNEVLSLRGTGNLYITGSVNPTSDDRLKTDETFISNALQTIDKLRPQLYTKWNSLDYATNAGANSMLESGLIAQEIYVDAPELRHLVSLPDDADPEIVAQTASNYTSSDDPTIDPEWPEWGSSAASVNYMGLIPYLIGAMKEMKELYGSEIEALKARITLLESV